MYDYMGFVVGKWHWDRFFSEYVCFSLLCSSVSCSFVAHPELLLLAMSGWIANNKKVRKHFMTCLQISKGVKVTGDRGYRSCNS